MPAISVSRLWCAVRPFVFCVVVESGLWLVPYLVRRTPGFSIVIKVEQAWARIECFWAMRHNDILNFTSIPCMCVFQECVEFVKLLATAGHNNSFVWFLRLYKIKPRLELYTLPIVRGVLTTHARYTHAWVYNKMSYDILAQDAESCGFWLKL